MVVKKKSECSIKDRSPLGLVGILLITAGVIIAIYDVKNALPNASASYVVVIGVILSIMGVISIILAFLGYRRSRALMRKTNGKVKDKGREKLQRRRFRRVSTNSGFNNGCNEKNELNDEPGEKMDGPSLVFLPQNYSVTIPSQSRQSFRSITGSDNYGFEKSPTHVQTYTILDSLENYQAKRTQSPLTQACHDSNSVRGYVSV